MVSDALVLLVEDDPDTSAMYATFLDAVGYRVVVAAHGRAALEALQHNAPDIVVTDLAMPVMDGFCLTRELRARPATRSTPIIAVTGQGMPNTPRLAREAGCCCLFAKPFLPDSLFDAIESMLHACPRTCVRGEAPCPVLAAAS